MIMNPMKFADSVSIIKTDSVKDLGNLNTSLQQDYIIDSINFKTAEEKIYVLQITLLILTESLLQRH